MRLKNPDYTKQGYELIRDIIRIIRFYQYNLNKDFHYRQYNRFMVEEHLRQLQKDFRLQWDIIRFLKKQGKI
jgi:hypothetical protein